MVFTANQTTAVMRLRREGIIHVHNLEEHDEKTIKRLADALLRLVRKVPDPDPEAEPDATVSTPLYEFGSTSFSRLVVACDLVRYYVTTGRDLTPANMQWNQVMKNFEVEWKDLKTHQKETARDPPVISKALPIIKWVESFKDFLGTIIGKRTIPLTYVIRESVEVPVVAPDLATNQPFSHEHGSVENELIARASHSHPSYKKDNAAVYQLLEQATRGTLYSASIAPYSRMKDGRATWLALTSQYTGEDKWQAELTKAAQFCQTAIWKGQSNFSLQSFITQHRNAFVTIKAAAQHISYQVPNERTRVVMLLDGIKNSDPDLRAAMAIIRRDRTPDGLLFNFEEAASFLLPADPVAIKRTAGNKRESGLISAVNDGQDETAQVSFVDTKPSIGKSGVHLRYHEQKEYRKLNKAQKDELREWRSRNGTSSAASSNHSKRGWKKGQGKKHHSKGNQRKGHVSAMVSGQASAVTGGEDEVEDYIKSLVKKTIAEQSHSEPVATSTVNASSASSTPPSSLNGILRRARNGRD